MKKVILTDHTADSSSDETIVIDSKEMLRFSKDEDFLFSSLVEFMNNLPAQVIDGRSVKEWFRLRDHSLWGFAHVSLWPRIDEHVRFIIAFENMIDTIHPEVVDINGFYDKIDLTQQICRKKNVRLSIGLFSRYKILLKSVKKKGAGMRRDIIARKKRAKRITIAREAKHEDVDGIRKGCVIFVAHETYRRRIYDFKTGQIREGEYIAQKILQQIKKMGADLLCIDVEHSSKGESQALRQRLNDKDYYWLPFELLEENKSGGKALEKTIDEIKLTLAGLLKNKNFQAIFNFNGIDLWNTLSARFDLLEEKLPQRVKDIEAAKDTLLRLEPKSIFLLYEKGPSAMTFIIAADELGIKTIGMQHGMIHKWHPDYAINDLRRDNSILGSPIPTTTIVFGEFYKRLLTERFAYPQDRVVVVGNPTYEGADIYSKQIDKKAALTRLGLDPVKKTLLVASSMAQKLYGKPDYDVFMIETLAKAFANYNGMQVVIKLHPKEDGTVYKKIIDESKASNFSIIDHPIEELILVCDVFLAVATTTILEAIVLEKPVIIIQAAEKVSRDVFSLVESGAAIGAKYEELAKKVLEILNNSALVEKLRSKGSEFAKQHFNLPNQEISLRIAEILTDPNRNA